MEIASAHGQRAPRFAALMWLVYAVLFLPVMLAPAPANAAESIENIELVLGIEGGELGREARSQLEDVIGETIETALMDHLDADLAYVENNIPAVVDTLGNVLSTALADRGFTLKEMWIEPGRTTLVSITLQLEQSRVESFEVDFVLNARGPLLDSVLAEDEEAVASALYERISLIPYNDKKWLASLVRETVEETLAALPGYESFEQRLIIDAGDHTYVAVMLSPGEGEQCICEHNVRIRSHTLLANQQRTVRDEAVYHLMSLHAVPANFASVRLGDLNAALADLLATAQSCASFCGSAEVVLELEGCRIVALIRPESNNYIAGLQGRIALWRYGNNGNIARIDARGGLLISDRFAIASHISYFPTREDSYPMVGGAWLYGNGIVLAGWDFEAERLRFVADHDLSHELYLHADYIDGDFYDDESEISLRYRWREDYEIQLVTNLEGEVFAALAANL